MEETALGTWQKTTGINALRLAELKDIGRQEWLKIRRTGIGGSDIAAIAGLNPYSSPLKVFMEKTGQLDQDEQTEAMAWGNLLEPIIAGRFAGTHADFKIQRVNAVLQSPRRPQDIADLDRLVVRPGDKNAVLECKNTSVYGKELWVDNEIPPYYVCQGQWYLGVTGLDHLYYAVLIGGNHYEERFIERDDELIAGLHETADRFWKDHILTNKAPEPTSATAEQDKELLGKMYKGQKKSTIDLPLCAHAFIESYMHAKQVEEDAAKIKENAANQLRSLLGDTEIGLTATHKVSWTVCDGKETFDTKAFREKHPDIFRQFASSGKPYRRFTISKNK